MATPIQMINLSRRPAALRPLRLSLGFAALALGLAACTLPQEVDGNLPDPDGVAQVQPGVSTKADVTRLMGSPSNIGTFDPNVWYYASRRIERDTLGDQTLLEQRVYIVEFDPKGVVKDLQTQLNNPTDVPMIARATPAPGKELSFIEQFLGNFGKFTGGDKKSDSGS
jgi:outer membrane protein assembly factor BamE (lipoprotein component of BamABCDE complex)